jgi:DNA-binding response OmpR family regulator
VPPRPLVLIVEDEPDMLLLLRLTLEDAGFETCLAADGETALRRIDAERPDVVLLDLMLPVLDGWGVLAELATRPAGPPVVICSATDGRRERTRAAELGAVAFVPKPFEVEDLVRVLREALAHRPARRGAVAPILPGVALDGRLGLA